MKKIIFLILLILTLSGCTISINNQKEKIIEICIASYDLGYNCGKNNKDYTKYKDKLIEILERRL